MKGDITIAGADITDLSPLKNIETITGKLTIQNNSSLPDLKGLEALTSVQHLLIYTNDLLTDLSGLEGLQSVSGIIHVRYHKNLTSLTGLDNLASVGSLYITNNDALTDLTGLAGLTTVTDLLSVNTNKALLTLNGLTNLTGVRRIIVGENDLLENLAGLEKLESVSYQMHITLNKGLLSLEGLDNLNYLSEAYITSNEVLPDLSGFEAVKGVKWLVVGENKKLMSLTGLNNLTSAENLIIRGNASLTNLEGLENLSNVGWLQIVGNAELLSLSALVSSSNNGRSNASARVAGFGLEKLNITSNPKLTVCAIQPVCSFLSSGTAVVSGNGSGCESESDIELACGTLPVELVSFTATSESNRTLLQWLTAQERNSAIFQIEHSVTGKVWQNVGENAAKGESNGPVNYQWIHQNPAYGINYYRLKMIDLDGTFTYSKIENLEFRTRDLSAGIVYPNPVSDKIQIDTKHEIIRLKILDLQGRTVYETDQVSKQGVSLKHLPAGAYQAQITTKTGTVQTDRIVIY
ncbi:T9SS type A sorting domain-containing protein [Dyadobacter jiangsuensis]